MAERGLRILPFCYRQLLHLAINRSALSGYSRTCRMESRVVMFTP
jgi:hypothetical protein